MIATTLEHKSVMRLDIIGTDENIQDAIVNYMPKLSHCGPSGVALAIAWRTNELRARSYMWMDSEGDR